jgi:hypothetical protein
MTFFDKNHPPSMFLFKVLLGWVFLFSLDAWLALHPLLTVAIYLTIAILTNHWTEWIYWQLVISWQLLVSRFKP